MEFAYFDNNKYKINIHNRNTMPKKNKIPIARNVETYN